MGGLSLPLSPFIPGGGGGGQQVGGRGRVWRWGVGSGWEREGLEMGEVGGVDNGWEVQWMRGGRIERRKSNTQSLLA